MPDNRANNATCDAWNPGITSQIPAHLKPLVSMFQPENSAIDYQHAVELAGFCGLEPTELVSFRVERLVVHELLVRVSSDLSVPDGPKYEDLGISLRSMVSTLFERYALPEMVALQREFDKNKDKIYRFVEGQLNTQLFDLGTPVAVVSDKCSFFSQLFKRSKPHKPPTIPEHPEVAALAHWTERASNEPGALYKASLESLVKVVSSMAASRGRVMNHPELIAEIVTILASNVTGSELVSELVEPIFSRGIEKEKYRVLPAQDKPVVMNVKGASASGKSTIRPQQRQLADKLGVPWEDFALISPDYWRKHLLDYNSLGDNYKYAAMLTGQELEIIDKKLDRYMAAKANRGKISHLLIDRFRFDSFNVEVGDHSRNSKLLSRFGDRIFLFFMITPPAETVVRAWQRGMTTGRFKAVDDLLYHNVEAYNGMPDLFFSWVLSNDKQVRFEFLDNSVEKGQVPETAAFGDNNSMTIRDVGLMSNIARYSKVNIHAKSADNVLAFDHEDLHLSFLIRCLNTFSQVIFRDKKSGNIYARVKDEKLVWLDHQYIKHHSCKNTVIALFGHLEDVSAQWLEDSEATGDVKNEKQYTLGNW